MAWRFRGWWRGKDGWHPRVGGCFCGSTSELLVGEERKPALHLIDPRAVGGGEMELEARMPKQPAMHQGRLVDAGVVEHEIHLELVGHLASDALEEGLELD